MSGKNEWTLVHSFLSSLSVLSVGSVIYHLTPLANDAKSGIVLKHKVAKALDFGRVAYSKNCSSCHSEALEG